MIGLNQILEDHKKWLYGEGGEQANLSEANLYRANLSEADLHGANLHGANLYRANLYRASLSEADLHGANLSEANLYRASLSEANLHGANLHGANLYRANLHGANLHGANLYRANLHGAKLPPYQICDGDIIGWKKIENKIIKLIIPKEAKRTSSFVGRKCRAEYAKVLEIDDGNINTIKGGHRHFVYTVGEIIHPDKYDDDPRIECTNGIHFFQTREEAEDY